MIIYYVGAKSADGEGIMIGSEAANFIDGKVVKEKELEKTFLVSDILIITCLGDICIKLFSGYASLRLGRRIWTSDEIQESSTHRSQLK